MKRSQTLQSGNWIAAATTASADAQPWPTSRLLPSVLVLSLAYVVASLCLTTLLGSPDDDVFFIEDIAMFALLLGFWLAAQPFLAQHSKKLQVAAKKPITDEDGAPQGGRGASTNCARGAAAFRARRAQRKKTLRCALEDLRQVVHSLSDAAASAVASACVTPRSPQKRISASAQNVHNFHAAPRSSSFLLPVEVAACHYPPDVCEHVRRQLEDRWAVLDSSSFGAEKWLSSIPE
eukprot:TRINITY_DN110816_c0_g1_i1.p2 TRINITY_DN110816_c0_g1~~TRINITY_DN110816_c0_g1_i1.p2  ORF type:complete len:235 (-),score=63.86 TRINITY_DN110816_c0_g1_i1:55-759(-)